MSVKRSLTEWWWWTYGRPTAVGDRLRGNYGRTIVVGKGSFTAVSNGSLTVVGKWTMEAPTRWTMEIPTALSNGNLTMVNNGSLAAVSNRSLTLVGKRKPHSGGQRKPHTRGQRKSHSAEQRKSPVLSSRVSRHWLEGTAQGNDTYSNETLSNVRRATVTTLVCRGAIVKITVKIFNGNETVGFGHMAAWIKAIFE